WTDLHGEGIPGVLTEQADAWFYKRNLSPASEGRVELAPQELVATKPNLPLAGGEARFMDLAGDGLPDLVVLDGPTPGLYEHDEAEGWQRFRPFPSRLRRDTRDPNLRFVDLDGDGRADMLITEDDVFVWHSSLGEEGFGPARQVRQAFDEERGPRLVFAESVQTIHLADMSGDGLTDLVRIRNGELCYWPNLGHGRFGAKVTMDGAPRFDNPDQFEPNRLLLADIDGSGTTDLIYLHRDGVRLHFNQSGNGWSPPRRLAVSPPVDDLVSIDATDLLGNGTACLVWSSPLPGNRGRPMRYVNLMGGRKPHLLVRTTNNLGAETRVEYAPSTKFYLQDKREGRPWVTRLPFPVHVVERVVTLDHISGNRFVTRSAYHHGYFDGEEREFRGFGMVEQRDTEELAALTADGRLPEASNEDAGSHVPPVLTKTWFHTGVYLGRDRVSNHFAGLVDETDRGEYYREPAWADDDVEARKRLLPDTLLPGGLTVEEEREACRALKGSMLRREVYALDRTDRAEHPYTVTEQNFTVRPVQPRGDNRHAVFFTHPREAITYHYERSPEDPRVQHALTLEVDPYGNVLRELAIGYGRRSPSTDPALNAEDQARQTRLLITYTENAVTNPLLTAAHYRTPLPAETRTYELTGFQPDAGALRFRFEDWTRDNFATLASAVEIPYEETPDGVTRQKRRIEHVRTLYRRDDLTALLPLGEAEPLALPGESYRLALTPGLLAQVFRRRQPGQPEEDLLAELALPVGDLLEGTGADQGGYVVMDGGWWIPSGRSFFDPGADVTDPAATAAQELGTARRHFYLPRKAADPFGQSTVVDYDGHDLLATGTRDALGNTVEVANDYRVLQPHRITDPNGNRTAAAFDALGMVVATAVMGKEDESLGDLLEGFDPDPPLPELQAFVADPRARAGFLLGKATSRIVYDLERYPRAGQPPFAATLARETHLHDPGGESTRIQIGLSYSDGFGREIQRKIQAEGGETPQREPPVPLPGGDLRPGDLVRNADGEIVQAPTPHRWVGSGRTVF
ncbi:MAG: toxin TcdB middle/C-terminal domain-containing protein, partial [Gemmatimonadota bacterium]